MKNTLLTGAAFVLLAGIVCATDFESERATNWHHWRGPDANGVAAMADPPVRWSEEENIKWKIEIPGKGSATPIVWNDRIFVLTAIETDRKPDSNSANSAPEESSGRRRGGFGSVPSPQNYFSFVVLCYDRKTGEKLWEEVATEAVPHESRHLTATFASGSPITDGNLIYATFGSRGIYCYDMQGSFQWSRDLGDMRTRNEFGEGASPTLHEQTLVVPWDHEGQSFVTALDSQTGEPRWKVERDEATTWATPLVVDVDGVDQVVLHGTNRVRSYDLNDGRLIWECGGQAFNPVATPIAADGLVYCTTGRRGYAMSAIPLSAEGDITGTEEIAWNRTDSGAYVSSPVIYKGQVYHVKECNAILSCLDAKTGEALFGPKRLPGLRNIYASIVAASDRIYITDREGKTLVLRHGPELEVLATNALDEGADASLVLVGKEIFLRSEQHLYCITEN
ncbi:MAG: PQQ-binding-like beta-propeller repeat protein [Aeoliella sp.]